MGGMAIPTLDLGGQWWECTKHSFCHHHHSGAMVFTVLMDPRVACKSPRFPRG